MTDYGHAMAIVARLERQAQINREQGQEIHPDAANRAERQRQRVEAADWRCRKCGAVSPEAKKSACEHSFTWGYDMVAPKEDGSR